MLPNEPGFVDDDLDPDESDEHDPGGLDLAFKIAQAAALGGFSSAEKRKRYVPKKRTKGGLTSLNDAMSGLIEQRGWRLRIDLTRLLADWSALVGETNAQHSKPEAYVDEVLTIRAESTAWATNLRLLAPQIAARLNAALGQGAVTRIEVLGPVGPTWKHGRRSVRDGRGPRDTYG